MPLPGTILLSAGQAWMDLRMLSMLSTEENRHTQNISSHTRLWNQKLPHRQQQQQNKRPSSFRAVKKDVTSILDWMDTCFRKSVSHKILNNLEISCMSSIKHCCLDEYGMSNSCILNCYCSSWGKFTRDCLLITYLRLLVSAVTMYKIILFWSRPWEHYCANGNLYWCHLTC